MISGNDFWSSLVQEKTTALSLGNGTCTTFKGMKSNMYNVLHDHVAHSPDKVGVVDDCGTSYTYKELLYLTDRLAAHLYGRHNVTKGKHIGVLLFNSVEFVISFLAAQKLGAIMIPYPVKYKEPEIRSLIEKSDCDLVIADRQFASWLENDQKKIPIIVSHPHGDCGYGLAHLDVEKQRILPQSNVSLEDPAIIMFTSGTTSESKGAVIRNINIQHAIHAYRHTLEIDEHDSTILAIPMYNVTGLIATLSLFLLTKGKVYLQRIFKVDRLLEELKKYNITFYHASPTIFTLMLNNKYKYSQLPYLKTLACGSGNMPIHKIKELKRWLPKMSFRTIYGLTETTSPATIFPQDASESQWIGSSGHPIPGMDVKIVDHEGNDNGFDQIGEIYVKGPNVIREYYQQKTNLFTKDHWLKTGDIGYISQAGYLFIKDRMKDMINRGGEKIFSYEVENAIYQIEGIREVAVIGISHDVYGEIPIAMLSLKKGYQMNGTQIKRALKYQLASYKIPEDYYIVKDICKTPNGKIDKKKLRIIVEQGGGTE
ncbi:acyl--CoA ligase [Bacillaceae bacterium SIJ1]|uniref:class I adenylate-forming enzyme family protein n=1 Tax=Litoribacterium kuwaitense TaxID=1398745 RepID=UPI0013EC0050|nr:class I adenylate-forming enzyme family protein [Litoribacterium kuwaitense]NGP46648.1 acyl--CoA ligase [Litoribacterium kuwaitense]